MRAVTGLPLFDPKRSREVREAIRTARGRAAFNKSCVADAYMDNGASRKYQSPQTKARPYWWPPIGAKKKPQR